MPVRLAELYANHADFLLLGGMAMLAATGIVLLLRRMFGALRDLRSRKIDAYLGDVIADSEEESWSWEGPIDAAAETRSPSRPLGSAGVSGPVVQPGHAGHAGSGEEIEFFDLLEEAPGGPSVADDRVAAKQTPPFGRLAKSFGGILRRVGRVAAHAFVFLRIAATAALGRVPSPVAVARRGWRATAAVLTRVQREITPRDAALFGIPRPGHRLMAAQASRSTSTLRSMLSPGTIRRQFGPAPRLAVVALSLAVALGYASDGRQSVEADRAVAATPDRSSIDASAFAIPRSQTAPREARTLPRADTEAAWPELGAVRAQAAAATHPAEQRQPAPADASAGEQAMERALLASRHEVDALRADLAAAEKAGAARLRDALAADRTLETLRRMAGEARTLLGETPGLLLVEFPAAQLERRRVAGLARDLSLARARMERLEIETADARKRAQASLAQATGMLGEERRNAVRLQSQLAEARSSSAELAARAAAAEQERSDAIAAKDDAINAAAEAKQVLARERASAASARDELDTAQIARDAAEKDRDRAVAAKQRAERAVADTQQQLGRERAAALLSQDDLKHMRLERDAARARGEQGPSRLQDALDRQREATIALARNLAALRAENERLRAERRSAAVDQPANPSGGRAATKRSDRASAVAVKVARNDLRKVARVTRSPLITLPDALLPRRPAVE